MVSFNDFISIPYLKFPETIEQNILLVENWFDYVATSIYIGVFYYAIYFAICYALVWTHPAKDRADRKESTKEEMRRGVKALFCVILATTFIIWKVVPLNPYYNYFETHSYGISDFLISLVVYLLTFDFWFYCTHIVGHMPFFWKHLHAEHHEFVEPGAFAQDAVHPIEALIQGPIGHFLPTFLYPYHPVAHHLFGLLTSVYAQLAHDGRWDPAGHTIHHYYYSCNYSIWGFSDYLFGTQYKESNYPVKYIPSWLRSKKD